MMKLLVVDENRKVVNVPYLLRLPGWTEQEYVAEAPQMQFCEFVRGELILHSPVGAEHQELVRFITSLLTFYCASHGQEKVLNGPAALKVAEGVIREPDIFVIPPEQAHLARGVPIVGVVPSLVIEVASASTLNMDLNEKAGEYATLGVPEYWVIDREKREFHGHRFVQWRYEVQTKKSGRAHSVAVPGFWLELDWLWRTELPPEPVCLKKIEET